MSSIKKFFHLLTCLGFIFLGCYMINISITTLTRNQQKLSPEISQVVDEVITKRGYKNQEDLHRKGQIGAISFLLIGTLNVGFFGYVAYRIFNPKKLKNE